MLSVREGELRRINFEKELWFELIFFEKSVIYLKIIPKFIIHK